ncbi:alternative splicing factor asf [Lichtheimia corymbifera JMRC:FSU:9682]|uniref:Alternative splicing factor asf n=1 Tax=Lichtheimia corymbifera JMRC:FSU:9682 TaxID=1263082 RepID=A0A068RLW3_9FUNG|nr:alternative splicing factor asf [Lichtheimia corymbifera JMRC:FSU:9682]
MSTRVYIGRLARDARDRDLERLFKSYGEIREINIKSGYGFVEFKDPRDAEDVVYDFHGKEFLGERIIVEMARGARRGREDRRRVDRRSDYRLTVENIPSGTSWQDLKDLMRKAGEVTFADVIRSRPGEGVVEFAHRSDMEYALKKLDDSELNGQRVRLFEDTSRRRGRGGSRSRSASRSRSPPRRSRRRSYSRSRSPPRRNRRRSDSRRRDDDRSKSPERKERRRDDSRSPSPRRASASPRRSPENDRSRSPARSRSPVAENNE